MSEEIKNRYDFTLIFDVKDGNPNGDPDAGNLPRVDPETGQGLVTDVCLKRKIRNYVQLTRESVPSYNIFVKEKAILNNLIDGAYAELGIDLTVTTNDSNNDKKGDKKRKGQGAEVESARRQMCKTYYDIRTFGAVLSTGANAGQVRGPVQLTFARSIDPIVTLEHSITRCAVATEADALKQSGDNRTMGRKNTVSYGLYRAFGFVSPALALQTGFNSDDLALLWEALKNMFEHDHSAARGMMSTCKLIVFKHASALGNASSGTLFSRVTVSQKEGRTTPPRDFSDYTVELDRANMPEGIEVLELA